MNAQDNPFADRLQVISEGIWSTTALLPHVLFDDSGQEDLMEAEIELVLSRPG